MADKADLSNTPIPQGFGLVPEVAAAGGGRDVVGNEIAKGKRKALCQDNATGAWHDFPDPPGVGFFRLSAADAIFETGLWHRLRPWGGTYMKPKWSSPHYEYVRVVVSVLATDTPLKPASPPPGGAEAAPSGEPTKAAAPSPPEQGEPEEQSSAVTPDESQHEPAFAKEPPFSRKVRRTAGAKPKYDWNAIQAYCYRWFSDYGFPDNVSMFCRDNVIPWCVERYDESKIPDEETLRQYVSKCIDGWQRTQPPPK
jgi:hypothetical protein